MSWFKKRLNLGSSETHISSPDPASSGPEGRSLQPPLDQEGDLSHKGEGDANSPEQKRKDSTHHRSRREHTRRTKRSSSAPNGKADEKGEEEALARPSQSQGNRGDEDLAMAYDLAMQEISTRNDANRRKPRESRQTQTSASGPSLTFGRGRIANEDLAAASALADSRFAAQQASELARANQEAYDAEISLVLEASVKTACYDDILRDIKLWSIDLAAATDDLAMALADIVRRRDEISSKLVKALDNRDEKRIRKLTWLAEQLPVAEARLRDLAEKVTPVGLAVAELEDLRETVIERSPDIEDIERQRDKIIAKLFNDMSDAGLHLPSTSNRGHEKSKMAPQSNPAIVRNLVADLIDDAQRLPKLPRKRATSSASGISLETNKSQEDPESSVDGPLTGSVSVKDHKEASSARRGSKTRLNQSNDETAQSDNSPQWTQLQNDRMALDGVENGRDSMEKYRGEEKPRDEKRPSNSATLSISDGRSKSLETREIGFENHEKKAENGESTPATSKLVSDTLAAASTSATIQTPVPHASPSTRKDDGDSTEDTESDIGDYLSKLDVKMNDGIASSAEARNPALRFLRGTPPQKSPSQSSPAGRGSGTKTRSETPGSGTTTIRRIPALVTLYNEIMKDTGIVSHAVGWRTESRKVSTRAPPCLDAAWTKESVPTSASDFVPGNPMELVEFVRSHVKLPEMVCTVSVSADRWTTMCAAAKAYHSLSNAAITLSTWKIQDEAQLQMECYKLVDYLNDLSPKVSIVSNYHTNLRTAMDRHRLPWDEGILLRVRAAAQAAVEEIMKSALSCARELSKQMKHRVSILQPLGHAVISAFKVHQFAGGFNGDAVMLCEDLMEQTLHYARGIDPKWFRGHKVVTAP